MKFVTFLKRVVIGLSIVGATGITLTVAIFLYAYLTIITHFDGSAELPADCAIVFGAAVYGIDTPSPALIRRTAAAADYYRMGDISTLIVSGGQGRGSSKETEAAVMKTLAVERGVRAEDVRVETEAHSTYENLVLSRNLTDGCSSVVGISDQYHLARIELLARRIGWDDLRTVPAQDRPPVGSERRSVLREVLAYIYYLFRVDAFIEL